MKAGKRFSRVKRPGRLRIGCAGVLSVAALVTERHEARAMDQFVCSVAHDVQFQMQLNWWMGNAGNGSGSVLEKWT
jgi:hypothetical protein